MIIDGDRLAKTLNLSIERVHQLVKEGLPKESRGRFDSEKCLRWYVRYLQAALKKKAVPMKDGSYLGEREQRVRLLKADADLREMELAKERGELVAISDVEAEMTNLVLTTKARILAVAPRVAPELLGLTSRVMAHAIVEKALSEALLQLSKRESRTYQEA
jgi:phage terminase Nu1 subunit (DNA packaging protein)